MHDVEVETVTRSVVLLREGARRRATADQLLDEMGVDPRNPDARVERCHTGVGAGGTDAGADGFTLVRETSPG